jgi:hypothetical protein
VWACVVCVQSLHIPCAVSVPKGQMVGVVLCAPPFFASNKKSKHCYEATKKCMGYFCNFPTLQNFLEIILVAKVLRYLIA